VLAPFLGCHGAASFVGCHVPAAVAEGEKLLLGGSVCSAKIVDKTVDCIEKQLFSAILW
jgi:hypothetical protein